jgi:hypothetical protein
MNEDLHRGATALSITIKLLQSADHLLFTLFTVMVSVALLNVVAPTELLFFTRHEHL